MLTAIKVEKLSKAYRLGEIGTGTISHDLERWFAKIRGKEDPFLKVGEANDRTVKGSSDTVWSLRDVNFEVEQGDAVGIIGRNGAGKSTLLKLLSRVTTPTTGDIYINGRIASLLEVGTGFHPDLTGRENIYLNGAILGMRKKEIAQKFDQIVDFAGVERYVDTPVKRYSTGMYVRLAFAVAAHLESEILIVDEVLAVGDLEFQRKCLGKMGDVSKGEGRTVLFVSHNMTSIAALCNKGILLNNGQVQLESSASECINLYHNIQTKTDLATKWIADNDDFYDAAFSINQVSLTDPKGNLISNGLIDPEKGLLLVMEGTVSQFNKALKLGYELLDDKENVIFTSLSTDCDPETWPVIELGENKIITKIPTDLLYPGKYSIRMHVSLHHQKWICNPQGKTITLNFQLLDSDSDITYISENNALIRVKQPFFS